MQSAIAEGSKPRYALGICLYERFLGRVDFTEDRRRAYQEMSEHCALKVDFLLR